MPIKEAAKKALRQGVKRAERNKLAGAELHSLRVKLRKVITAGKQSEAAEIGRAVMKKMDKMVSRGMLKKNTVARLKSRLAAKVNAIKK